MNIDVVCYYYDPVKAPLLRNAVLPIARELAATGVAVHVERHWLHGPHVKLRISGEETQARAVATVAAQRLAAYLAEHPSTCVIDEAALLADAQAAGDAELVPPPYTPLYPDNRVRIEAADDDHIRALLHGDGVEVRAQLLRSALPALSATTDFLGEHGDAASARLHVAVGAMAAHASRFPGAGLTGGYHSFVSHLEDFLANDDPGGRLAAAFESRWEQHADQTSDLVARIADGRMRPWEGQWSAWSAAAWRYVDEQRRGGALLTGGGGRRRAAFSEYHQLMHRVDPEGSMRTRPDALVYRWCTNALYLLLAVCDVRPLERYLAAFLLTRAVPAVTGHSWRAEMAAAIDQRERV